MPRVKNGNIQQLQTRKYKLQIFSLLGKNKNLTIATELLMGEIVVVIFVTTVKVVITISAFHNLGHRSD
jgi:hypothetical protein